MKKCFLLFILLLSCSLDDSELSENNTPIGKLIKIETSILNSNSNFTTTYLYNSSGKLNSSVNESYSPSGNNTYSTSHFYNDQGQIWKSISNNDITEFQFTNGLITSSTRTFNGSTDNREYIYNNSNQLIQTLYLDETNSIGGNLNLIYNGFGNIQNTIQNSNGTITEYQYEYDNKKNPLLTAFEDQEISKLSQQNLNNKTKRTWIRDIGTIIYTKEYTYNDNDFPVSMSEYQNGTLITETTYTYQE